MGNQLPVSLDFQGHPFDVVDHMGQPWLRGSQVGDALGYEHPDSAVSNLYKRHAHEFTEQMTAVVKVPDLLPQIEGAGGQRRDVRIFSARGCWALTLFARGKRAEAFRAWVLDVLEQVSSASATPLTTAGSATPRLGEAETVVAAGRCFGAYLRAAGVLGLDPVERLVRANRATQRRTGVDLMDDLGVVRPELEALTRVDVDGNAAPTETVYERAAEFASGQDRQHWYFTSSAWEQVCFGFDTMDTAGALRRRGLLVCEAGRLQRKAPGSVLERRPRVLTLRKEISHA